MAATDMDFATFLRANSVDESAEEYLRKRGLSSSRLLTTAAEDEKEFVAVVVKPFIDGWEGPDKKVYKAPDDPIGTRAALVLAFREANLAARPPFPPPPATTALALTAPPPAHDLRPKTSLDKGEWRERIEAYESMWTPRRTFPKLMLVGAEHVLARMLDEAKGTREYTPLFLGEIVRARSFTATGDPNPDAIKFGMRARDAQSRAGASNSSVPYSEDSFDVRGAWQVNDALEAVKWALVFAGWAPTDDAAAVWTNYFADLVRARPRDLEHVKSYYTACSWRLAFAMRGGTPFTAAVESITQCVWKKLEHFEGRGSGTGPRGGDDHNDGGGGGGRRGGGEVRKRKEAKKRKEDASRGRKAGAKATSSPRGRRGQRSPSRSRSRKGAQAKGVTTKTAKGQEICRKHNTPAGCKGGRCNYAHVCNRCLHPKCSADICTRQ